MDEPDVPNRIIWGKANASNTLRTLSDPAERAWWRLIAAADDYGRFDADPEVLLAILFQRRPSGWNRVRMIRALEEWVGAELVHAYRTDAHDGELGHVVKWFDYQRRRDSNAKFPEPPCGDSPQLAAKCGESRLARARSVAESREPLADKKTVAEKPAAGRGELRLERLVEIYHHDGPDEAPTVESLSAGRRTALRELIGGCPAAREESWWAEVFAQIRRSRFLSGRTKPKPGHSRPFVVDLDWLLAKGQDKVENAVRVHDGRYRDA